MKNGMKVHLFKISWSEPTRPLDELLEIIGKTPIGERIRSVVNHDVRMEDIKQEGRLWLLDFGMLRYEHGPGRARRAAPIEGFDLAEGEGFGEETAAVFDTQTGFMAVQYNHAGVRAGTIARYLSRFESDQTNAYDMEIKFDPEAERRLAGKKFFSRLRVKVNIARMHQGDRAAGRSLHDALALGRGFGANHVLIELSMGKHPGRGLDNSSVTRALGWVRSRLRSDAESIDSAEIAGKENPDAALETIDLIHHRLSITLGDLPLGPDLRYPRNDRWQALKRAMRGWSGIIRAGG